MESSFSRSQNVEGISRPIQRMDAHYRHQASTCFSHRDLCGCSRQCEIRLGSMAAPQRLVDVQTMERRFLSAVPAFHRFLGTVHIGGCSSDICQIVPYFSGRTTLQQFLLLEIRLLFLLCFLTLFCMTHNITILARHVCGVHNTICDKLSHFQFYMLAFNTK